MMAVQLGERQASPRIEELKQLIDNEEYLIGAIQRLAQVLSDEILDMPVIGAVHERFR